MAGAYSTDLRSRALAAVEAGESPEAVAQRFLVGRSTVYRWAAAARDEGRREARRMGGGPPPAIRDEAEAALRRMLGGPGAAADGLDLKEAEPAGGRAGPCGRGGGPRGVADRGHGWDRRDRARAPGLPRR